MWTSLSLKSGTHFPPAGPPQSVLQLRPFVWVVDLYVLVGRVAPVLFVHKGQVCLNAGADKRNPLPLQALALPPLQVRLGYDGRHAGQLDEACLDALEVGERRVP